MGAAVLQQKARALLHSPRYVASMAMVPSEADQSASSGITMTSSGPSSPPEHAAVSPASQNIVLHAAASEELPCAATSADCASAEGESPDRSAMGVTAGGPEDPVGVMACGEAVVHGRSSDAAAWRTTFCEAGLTAACSGGLLGPLEVIVIPELAAWSASAGTVAMLATYRGQCKRGPAPAEGGTTAPTSVPLPSPGYGANSRRV